MSGRRLVVGLALLRVAVSSTASAEPLRPSEVPEPLRPWVDWVLRESPDAACTTFHADAERRQCAWPARLTLALDEQGGTFTQRWDVERDLWVDLPGDARHWPQDATVDGAAAVVVAHGGIPRVKLSTGRRAVTGRFLWQRLPELLPIPATTGLLELSVGGQAVPFPNRDSAGRLWLQRREEPEGEGSNRIDVAVHRLVDDDIPLVLATRLQLDVSGTGREVLLGPLLPEGFIPMALDSPLPARLEPDGRLRLQVRPGRWALEIRARHDGPTAALTAPEAVEPWSPNEVWVFGARPALRLVDIEGVDSIDPQQTDLPAEWRALPAYLLRAGDTMRLVERRRGDADPAPDQLALVRTLWLDFGGGGYTIQDRITGTLWRSARLDMLPPTRLGRVAVDGIDQFITRLGEATAPGVEIRTGVVRLDADSRLDGTTAELPAVSWDQDFTDVSALLQLPPGWRIIHAMGVDDAGPTWIKAWTLLDLFLVLITALATARLYGWLWGIVALFAIGLTYTEPGAPQWIWLALLSAEALVRIVPAGRVLSLLRLARIAALVGLVVIAISFAAGQLREALYPALEYPAATLPTDDREQLAATAPPSGAPEDETLFRRLGAQREGAATDLAVKRDYRSYVDPLAVVQTGPGVPRWRWTAVALAWSGPVERDQRLRLLLLPPWANLLLALVRTALLAVLLIRVIGGLLPRRVVATSAALLAVAALAGVSPPPAAHADFPSAELLEQLRERLREPPACHPICAALPRMRLEVGPHSLRARLEADVAAATAVPLPGQAQHWLPRSVVVDGEEAVLMQGADGLLWLRLDVGRHQVLLEGPLPARDTVQILLPLTPHRVEAQVDGWTLDGVREDGVAEANLQLGRAAPESDDSAAPLQPDQLPPFARVERTLLLPLTWQVETRVVRLTPADAALVLEVPLLPGEAVTTQDVRVVGDKVQINLAAQASETRWQSTLGERSPIELRAASQVAWVEVWRLDASSVWHVEARGIPPVHRTDPAAAPAREWRPWPGEAVTLDITRPAGAGGQTLTVDHSAMQVSPGLRATDVTLALALRSSRGTQHTVRLPAGAELQSVSLDGAEQPIRQEAESVVLPVRPGTQRVDVTWRKHDGIETVLRTPAVDLGTVSVNAELQVVMPANRWILLAGGPRFGPAVLFWSLLPVVLLVALGLGRVRSTPLRTWQWFLLGVGLTQVDVALAVVVVGWLLALGWRRARDGDLDPFAFDLMQMLLVLWTAAALVVLFLAIQRGLLGAPDMQIAGNGSSAALLRWYQDRAAAVLPQAWVLSVPLLVYRLLMLAWALWLAQALLRWLRWGWECFGTAGFWRALRRRRAAVG
jgi:hypothetical protein